MKVAHLALVALVPSGRVEHPVDSVEAVQRVWERLAPLVDPSATWHVEEVA